jgi:GntR family transcriptional regulator, transcriptional repressor for pyruvate dehydrogenase complex
MTAKQIGVPVTGNGDTDAVGLPAGRRRIHEMVLHHIEDQIARGELKAGDRLPAERDMAAALGVSRPAVREAIRVLEAMGTVVQGTGSGPDAGTVLSAVPGDALTHLLSLHVMLASIDTADVVRARIALERESTRLAAKHAGPDDHRLLEAHLAAMADPDIGVAEFNDRDTAFHLAIAQASGNILVAELTTALRTAMRPTLLRALQAVADFPAMATRLAIEHRSIHAAIQQGDGDLAASRVEAHIDGFYTGRTPQPAANGRTRRAR